MGQVSGVTSANFQSAVLEHSRLEPVLVDFWAPWCGPCRTLGPVLDQLAAETQGLKVVKLNTDEEGSIAAQYAIRSIPAVKLFRDGRVVDEFVGAQPLGAVREFVRRHLSKGSATGLEAARSLRASGQLTAALEQLRTLHAAEPTDDEVAAELAECLGLTGDPAAGRTLLQGRSPQAQASPAVKHAYATLHFVQVALSPDETDAIQTARVTAARELLRARHNEGIDALLAAAGRNRRYAVGAGKEDLLEAFVLAAADETLVAAARRRLAALLH
ncbi:MAG: thioredoxin [Sinobacteraceae bacterium]|nr:thioredoxin [Nevskiaceae bacterium]